MEHHARWQVCGIAALSAFLGAALVPQERAESRVATRPQEVDTYAAGMPTGLAQQRLLFERSPIAPGREQYGLWVGARSPGSGDGSVEATTFALGAASLKADWATTAVRGQAAGLNSVVRGGYHGPDDRALAARYGYDPSGDAAGILTNVVVSSPRSFVAQYEGVNYLAPKGAFGPGLRGIRAQIGPIQDGANPGIGFLAIAANGQLGAAFQAQNELRSPSYGVGGRWTHFLRYVLDDGKNPLYEAFAIDRAGAIVLNAGDHVQAGRKLIRVGTAGDLEILDSTGRRTVARITESGDLHVTGRIFSSASCRDGC